MIRSGLVIGVDASRNRSGGAVAHLRGLMSGSDPRDYGIGTVHLWAYDSLRDKIAHQPWLVKHDVPELRGSIGQQLWWQFAKLPKIVDQLGCDLVFNTDAGSVCPARRSVTLSQDMLSFEPGEMERYGVSRARLRLEALRIVQARSLKRARLAIYLTEHARRTIEQQIGRTSRSIVIAHGIDTKFRAIAGSRRRFPAGEPVKCLYVSNTAPYKHQWHVVEAIAFLRREGHTVELALVGGGSGPAHDRLDRAVVKFDPRREFVTQTGFVPNDAIPDYLARSDLFIFASSCENLPITMLEAMASGIPICSSNRGPMPEVLGEAGSYFDPERPELDRRCVTSPDQRRGAAVLECCGGAQALQRLFLVALLCGNLAGGRPRVPRLKWGAVWTRIGMDRPRSRPHGSQSARGLVSRRSTTMPRTTTLHAVTAIGIDMGKTTLHMIGLDARGAIVLRERVSRGRIASRLANVPPCLIGIEAGMATHYVARELGHDVKQVPATYAKSFRQGHKNDFRDAHAVAEAVQRPTTRFVPAKTNEQLDLQALHRVRSRLVSERTEVINQIRGFLLERSIIVRQGLRFLRQLLPDILAKRTDVLSPRMVRIVIDLAGDWRQLDERIETVTDEIETLAKSEDSCRRVMTVPGIGPIISSAMVAAIGSGVAFAKGRDFSAWLGLVPTQMSTGDRTILGRISKRGNGYLRMLFMQAARVILLWPANWPKHGFGVWLVRAAQRLHPNVLAASACQQTGADRLDRAGAKRSYQARVTKAAA